MSAIWGLWYRDGRPLDARVCESVRASLSAYGSHRTDSWLPGDRLPGEPLASQGIAMGCALAPTVPEDLYDRQPLVESAGASVLVADLRLDNRQDLLRDLGISAGEGDRMADSSVLHAAWVRWGEGCLQRLIGDFAFAIWDRRTRRLVCARDHFGRRPLHYVQQGPLFAFASFPRGLLALPGVPPAVDETMIAMRLAALPEATERSFFRNIQRLPPGHFMVVGQQGLAVRRYWNPDPGRRITFSKDSDYVENFRTIFDEAVRCRLRSTGPVGSMLSGGFDSGSVSATAARLLGEAGRQLTAFTSVPNPASGKIDSSRWFADESHHAAAVAGFYPNIKHVLVQPSPGCVLDLLGEFRQWKDMPELLPSTVPYRHAMVLATQRERMSVVLSGAMGNITISHDGLSLLPDLLRHGRFLHWATEVAALKRSGRMSLRNAFSRAFRPFIPRPRRSRSGSLRNLYQYSLIHPALASSGTVAQMLESFDLEHRFASRGDSRRMRAAAFVRADFGSGHSGASMTGVDSRDPTSDKRLAEFCLAIPDEQFLRNGQPRFILQRAFAGRLPSMVLDERRKGMTGADWYLRVAPYRDRFHEAVERVAQSPAAQSCLDITRMRHLVDRWPRDGWSDPTVVQQYRLALCRSLSVGDFICWVESGASA